MQIILLITVLKTDDARLISYGMMGANQIMTDSTQWEADLDYPPAN